ncbi:MAG: DNA polymerase/3'-5' exonuclease PolX [Caldilineae bacterium]|nr:MAG: DNA polymerase/3'-5' exonuclease PolX [Caldilineae bacterium]
MGFVIYYARVHLVPTYPQFCPNPVSRLTNKDVADTLRLLADILEIKGENRFRVLAFRSAADSVEGLGQDLYTLHAAGSLTEIPGVGKGIAADIAQLLETGELAYLEELKREVPLGVVEMMRVPDMGPKKAARLWQELGITSVAELKAAAESQKLRGLKGFGAKSEERILKGIALWEARREERTPLGVARPAAEQIVAFLREHLAAEVLQKLEIAGSVRRWKETIGDLDILAVSESAEEVMAAFRQAPSVVDVLAAGSTKSRVRLASGLECDLRVVAPRHWGAALQYFTGSKEHNVALRELALKQGWSLNEYGLTATGRGSAPEGVQRFFDTEEALYDFLGLEWIPPELREGRGEIDLARRGGLPQLLTADLLQGELHGHSTWSDGQNSIEEMAEAARARGYRYWAVCDHSVGLGITGGVDADGLRKQAAEIEALNQRWRQEGVDFRLLRGIEVEILADGTLGLPDDVLAELDVVVASIHSSQRQDRETITERCLRAVRNPHVDILGHPSGRLLGRRPPTDIDLERVLQTCAETGTVVEINAHPYRLDLNDIYARRAVELGCKIAINTDAHSPADMDLMPYGVATARRAWLTAEDVINTRPLEDMLALLKSSSSSHRR